MPDFSHLCQPGEWLTKCSSYPGCFGLLRMESLRACGSVSSVDWPLSSAGSAQKNCSSEFDKPPCKPKHHTFSIHVRVIMLKAATELTEAATQFPINLICRP